jgi:hypothetical protein
VKTTVTLTVKKNHISSRIRGVKSASDGATLRTAKTILAGALRRVRVYRGPHRDWGESVKDSLAIRQRPGASQENGITLQVGSFGSHKGKPVAVWLETGTAHAHAFPYLHPAATEGRKQLKTEQQAAVKAECDKNE